LIVDPDRVFELRPFQAMFAGGPGRYLWSRRAIQVFAASLADLAAAARVFFIITRKQASTRAQRALLDTGSARRAEIAVTRG